MSGEGECDEDKDYRDWVTYSDWIMSGEGDFDEDKDDRDRVTESDCVMSDQVSVMKIKMIERG
jgi:hypothetical protein